MKKLLYILLLLPLLAMQCEKEETKLNRNGKAPNSWIEGYVYDYEGDTIEGVKLKFYDPGFYYNAGTVDGFEYLGEATTDSNGYYRFGFYAEKSQLYAIEAEKENYLQGSYDLVQNNSNETTKGSIALSALHWFKLDFINIPSLDYDSVYLKTRGAFSIKNDTSFFRTEKRIPPDGFIIWDYYRNGTVEKTNFVPSYSSCSKFDTCLVTINF